MWAEAAVRKHSHLHSRAVFHVLRATLKQVCKTGILIAGILACVHVRVCACVLTHASGRLWRLLLLQHLGRRGAGGVSGARPGPRQAAVCGGEEAEPWELGARGTTSLTRNAAHPRPTLLGPFSHLSPEPKCLCHLGVPQTTASYFSQFEWLEAQDPGVRRAGSS